MSHSSLYFWIVIGIIASGTFVLRLSFIGWMDARKVPAWLTRVLRFIPPAVLAALILPAVVGADADPSVVSRMVPLIAAVIALGVAWRTENMLFPIGAGMTALWTLRALLPG